MASQNIDPSIVNSTLEKKRETTETVPGSLHSVTQRSVMLLLTEITVDVCLQAHRQIFLSVIVAFTMILLHLF